jgi:hypothetical protein
MLLACRGVRFFHWWRHSVCLIIFSLSWFFVIPSRTLIFAWLFSVWNKKHRRHNVPYKHRKINILEEIEIMRVSKSAVILNDVIGIKDFSASCYHQLTEFKGLSGMWVVNDFSNESFWRWLKLIERSQVTKQQKWEDGESNER